MRNVRFVVEQDGTPEKEFKERVIPLLRANGAIDRAYLARVEYSPSSLQVVALCFRPQAVQDALLGQIGEVFALMFGRDEHLDMLFLNQQQELELARVCVPFFESKQ